ncbi:hypothetical protein M422DRAFT_208260 [Sphaerobolus stellatus SS14]|uniref:Transcription factor spt8 beta-propeller domain-containing protein n=1 Tax=Sphaerobolus stellatus (strain SS14) TaxID=990650 RepID=A0A0C9VYF0_SPHS4|nr:hypothetical protein M422DRAFT_208260 [Sphaerobolus stellatus SS14]
MARSDSEDGFGNEKEYDFENDNDGEAEESDAEGEVDAEGENESEGDEESGSDSEDDSEEGEEENDEEDAGEEGENDEEDEEEEDMAPSPSGIAAAQKELKKTPTPPPTERRSLSPAFLRRSLLYPQRIPTKSYTIETVCAMPHPVATHSLASSLCMTHLLTGSEDGYIRDYDVYTACNGKNFLSQPQRQHCGIQEGAIKAPVARMWWDNPLQPPGAMDENPIGPYLSPVYSMLMQSDALWGLSGTLTGNINLFTVRHDPGRVVHTLTGGHTRPVSSMTMLHGEKGFISAGWDGNAVQWDLNTGQTVRTFWHGPQLTTVAMRPLSGPSAAEPDSGILLNGSQNTGASFPSHNLNPESQPADLGQSAGVTEAHPEGETKSEASYDPLFDDEPESPKAEEKKEVSNLALPNGSTNHAINPSAPGPSRLSSIQVVPPPKKPAIPLLDPVSYREFSTDILLAASIDGQVVLWDRRAQNRVGRLEMGEKCPPWCLSACWSYDGSQIYAGRRNETVDIWDVRILGKSNRATPRLLKSLRNPPSSGAVSAVVAFPDGNHVACASHDNIRLWNVAEAPDGDAGRRATPAFKIIAGHHGGIISQLLVDVGARFMVSASGNRGWSGDSTKTVLVHDVKGIR